MAKTVEPMTSGSISKRMIFFALPLLLGNLFQQLYNTVDSLIVGNFLGSSALAAVSSSDFYADWVLEWHFLRRWRCCVQIFRSQR